MPSLSHSLANRCRELLAQCPEFASIANLRAVFVTDDLKPFQSGLPEAASAEDRARLALPYLLDKTLVDGRAPLVLLLDALQERHALEDLGTRLSRLRDDVQAHLGSRAAEGALKRQKRRIDAALPAQAELNQHIDLYVQVRFPASKPLSIKDWPVKHRPAQLEQQSSMVALNFPVNRLTGKPGPILLQLHVTAPDFKVEGPDQRKVEVFPGKFSDKAPFLLTPLHAGACRVNVEVKSTDEVWLGTLPLETVVGGAAAAEPRATVANLVLTVDVKAPAAETSHTVVVAPGQASVTISLAKANQITLQLRETTDQLEGIRTTLEKTGTKNSPLARKALDQTSALTARLRELVRRSQSLPWASVSLTQRQNLVRQADLATKQLDTLSRLYPTLGAGSIVPGLPRRTQDLTRSLRGLSVEIKGLTFKK